MAVATFLTIVPAAAAATAVPSTVAAPTALLPAAVVPADLFLAAALSRMPLARVKAKGAAIKVIAEAKSHLGARYVWGSVGPRTFDCVGLVLRSYADAGVLSKIGGWSNSSGYAMYRWARRHHLASRTKGLPGDVVVWGGGAHVGIYLGNGMAVSALVSGVRIASIYALTNNFTAFIHTGLASVPGPRYAKLMVTGSHK